jgi:hypothetical protein
MSGTVRGLSLKDPGMLGALFGNITLFFMLDPDEEIETPWGHRGPVFAVRLDSFRRIPEIEGRKVIVEGYWDSFNRELRATAVSIPDAALVVRAPRRLTAVEGITFVACLLIFQTVSGLFFFTLSQLSTWLLVLCSSVWALVWIAAGFAASFTIVPGVVEKLHCLLRRIFEVR